MKYLVVLAFIAILASLASALFFMMRNGRNDKSKGLLNGGSWIVQEIKTSKKGLITMRVTPEDDVGGKAVKVSVMPNFFDGTEDEVFARLSQLTRAAIGSPV